MADPGLPTYSEPLGLEIQLQVSSKDWLEVYGLLAQSLTLDRLLPSLGFQQSADHVNILKRTVSSQYADGLFVQEKDSSGNIYNLCDANPDTLSAIEQDLQKALAMFKARYKWLTTDSRLSVGVICERQVVLVMDTCSTEHAQLKPYLEVVVSVAREQLSRVEKFNMICCSNGVDIWKPGLVESSDDIITSAIQWVEKTTPQATPFKTNVVEGVVQALAHSEAQSVYLVSNGKCTLRAFDLLMEKVSSSLIPLHVVVYNCKTPQALEQYQKLAAASRGRFHAYTPPPAPVKTNPLLSSFSSLSSASSRPQSAVSASGRGTPRPQSAISKSVAVPGVVLTPPPSTEDMHAIAAEIELARSTLAEIQALRLEVGASDITTLPVEPVVSEDSLTSQQWLEIHGIKAKKLRYEDLVSSLAFQHCNGIVKIPVPKYQNATQTIEVVPHSKIVHAQYCKDFVHISWKGEKTVHVQLTGRVHHTYQAKVEGVVKRCEERLAWLKQGSRQLFGTLLESKVVILVDTSSSLKNRLQLIKNKVKELLQEQLSQKKEFTIMHFNSEVHAWRTSLVPTSPQNLLAVGQWVESLDAEGSTNTLAALEAAMTVREAEAVYLLTDGRPDQPLDELVARVQQLPSLPVHTISFNCADSKANRFLAQLATDTGGRYYYFSEDTTDTEGPNTYQSEDIELLEQEVAYGREQLQLAAHLLTECNAVRKGKRRHGSDGGGGAKKGEKTLRRNSKSANHAPKNLLSSKKWLEKNSLSALHLTLMDAFGPASIPHGSKHVPLLGKEVSSRVFSSLFPLAHVTSGNEVTLIHPNGVDLREYEKKLDRQLEVYWTRLSRLAWSAIPVDKRPSLGSGCELNADPLPYKDHRKQLRGVLSQCGWPCPQEDFDLLENEINLGVNFKKYLKAVKQEVERSSSRSKLESRTSSLSDYQWSEEGDSVSGEEVVGLYSPSSDHSFFSLTPTLTRTMTTPTSAKKKSFCKRFRNGQQVAVRPKEDGFFYPGVVKGYSDKKHVIVELMDKAAVTSSIDDVYVVGAGMPCPLLAIGDCVLARVRTRNGPHPSVVDQSCDCYIPGMVCALPADKRKGTARYSILTFNGKGIVCSRLALIKISESKYREVSAIIKDRGVVRPTSARSEGHDEEVCQSHSSLHSGHRTPIRVPCVEKESPRPSPHPSPQPSPHHVLSHPPQDVDPITSPTLPVVERKSHSGSNSRSRTPSALSLLSHSGSKVHQTKSGRSVMADSSPSPSPQRGNSEEVRQLLEQQVLHGEQLEQQQKDLSDMLSRQLKLEAQVAQYREMEKATPSPSHTHNIERDQETERTIPSPSQEKASEESSGFSPNRGGPKVAESMPPANVVAGSESQDGDLPQVSSKAELQEAELARPVTCEQAVNTDAWTQERGIGTDPMTTSQAVGTECFVADLEPNLDTPPETPAHRDVATPTSEPDIDTPQGTPRKNTPAPVSDSELEPDLNTPQDKQQALEPDLEVEDLTTPVPTLPPTPCSSPLRSPCLTPTRQSSLSPAPDPDETTPIASFVVDPCDEQDPLVNQHVLARWPDDGWYYRALVVRPVGQMWYQVTDAAEDMETIHVVDILIDLQDAQKPVLVGDTVAALHPEFSYSYAPGKVTGVSIDGYHFSVKFYDGAEGFLPRQDVYHLAQAKHQRDVEYLRTKERAWVGQAVVARRDRDGVYVPGEVMQQVKGACRYLIKWADEATQVQEVIHMFGLLTKIRGFRVGDHILALALPNIDVFMPGTILDKVGQDLQVEFCDGQNALVDPSKSFWISSEYYQDAVEFIADHVSSTSSSSQVSLPSVTLSHSPSPSPSPSLCSLTDTQPPSGSQAPSDVTAEQYNASYLN